LLSLTTFFSHHIFKIPFHIKLFKSFRDRNTSTFTFLSKLSIFCNKSFLSLEYLPSTLMFHPFNVFFQSLNFLFPNIDTRSTSDRKRPIIPDKIFEIRSKLPAKLISKISFQDGKRINFEAQRNMIRESPVKTSNRHIFELKDPLWTSQKSIEFFKGGRISVIGPNI
jgi:hypothetical protein